MNITETKQEEFAVVMMQKIAEQKASNLIDYAEKATVNGANTYNFYRLGESQVGTNELKMFADSYSGNGGDSKKYTATIDYVYASDKIKAIDIKSTSLNLEDSYVKSLSDALKRNCDKKILDKIAAEGSLDKVDLNSNQIDSDEVVNALIESAVLASTNVKMTVSEGRTGVALVVDTPQYARLFRAEKITNNNWSASNKFMVGTLFGCDVVKVAKSTKGTEKIYLIPAGTFGVASFENDVEAKSWWEDAEDSLFCRVKRSMGVAVMEPESIIEITHAAIA